MSKRKWGESFLKSGLPLEHLTHVTFRNLNWDCRSRVEFLRQDKSGSDQWFELDLEAESPNVNRSTRINMLVECKYHDLSRYWMFLPHQSEGRWQFNDRALNCGPLQTLDNPSLNSILDLAPLSSNGIVVAEDGTKQDNAVYVAMQQITNGFIPVALMTIFQYNIDFHNINDDVDEREFIPFATALIPAIVTNARIFRMRPDVTDIERIRMATDPADIADELPWTWCYHEPTSSQVERNFNAIKVHKDLFAELVHRYPGVENRMNSFDDRPNWVAIINIKHLDTVVKVIENHFAALKTRTIQSVIKAPASKRR